MKRFAIPLMLSCTWLVACGDESTGSLKAQALTRVQQQDDLDGCNEGGVTISSGVDTNKDGKLDDDEVTEEQVICAGETVDVPPIGEGGELTRVDILGAGDAMCPAGGVAVHRGTDEDNDEALSDEEIEETEYLCSPVSDPVHDVLARTTDVAIGSADCIWGGKRLESGVDDGEGEGEPDDGILHDAEVDTSYLVCNGSPPAVTEPTDPPAGTPGTATINVRGANSMTGTSGSAGGLYGGSYSCLSAITKFFTTGSVDAAFTIPEIALDYGSVRFDVATDATVVALPVDPTTRTDGAHYLDSNSSAIVRWNATASSLTPVTGLTVAAGATLTIPVVSKTLEFDRDINVAGRIALTDGANRNLTLYARNIRFADSSVIDLTGSSGSPSALSVYADSSLIALGSLSVAGSDTAAAIGGNVDLQSDGRMYVGGTIDASGGDSAAASGAAGGTIRLTGGIGGVWSSATLKAFGGTGALLGGAGGTVTIGQDNQGDSTPREIRNSGSVDVSGGSQSQTGCNAGPCSGGAGGTINVLAQGADLRSSGALKANGGSSHLAAGTGGTIRIGIQRRGEGSQSRSRLSLTGDLHAQGGEGFGAASAGGGGYVYYDNCGGNTSVTELLGYQSIVLSGGTSTTAGGAGGQFYASDTYSDSNTSRRYYYNVPIAGKGGDGAEAGRGGSFELQLSLNVSVAEELPNEVPAVVLGGAHVLNGGSGTTQDAGSGGYFYLAARGTVTTTGSVELNGGNSSVAAGFGGSAAIMSLLGDLQNHATFSANAGTATMSDGPSGGCIDFQANALSNDAKLSARGGAGMTFGGDGGNISLTNVGGAGTNTGELDVAGGAGTTPGGAGVGGFGVAQCGRAFDAMAN
jgi:hypothetical protein